MTARRARAGAAMLSLAACFFAAPLSAATARRLPSNAAAIRWAQPFEAFLRGDDRDAVRLYGVLPLLSGLDFRDAAVRVALEPLTLRIQTAADAALSAPRDSKEAQERLAEKMALLSHPLVAPHLRDEQRARLGAARELLMAAERARLESVSLALAKALQPDAKDNELVLAQTLSGPGGRRGVGSEQAKQVSLLADRHAGQARLLSADGQDAFVLEVGRPAREKVLRELRSIENLEAHPLSEILAAAAAPRQGAPLADAGAFAALKDRLSAGTLLERWRAFAALAAGLENATPAQMEAIPAVLRDEALEAIRGLADMAADAFNAVRGDLRRQMGEREYYSSMEDTVDHAALDGKVHERLQAPELKGRSESLRALFGRVFAAVDLLGTDNASARALQWLPRAESIGLESVLLSAENTRWFIDRWLALVRGSVLETLKGQQLILPDEQWSAPYRAGGYKHLVGQRQSLHLYRMRPYRQDPAEIGHHALLIMGFPEARHPLARMVVRTLAALQWTVPEIDDLRRKKKIREEVRRLLESVQTQGNIPAEQLPIAQERVREQVEARYDKNEEIDGHTLLDSLLRALGELPRYVSVPGFDFGTYVAGALELFEELHASIGEVGLLMQVTDSAVEFLSGLARDPRLAKNSHLREKAAQTWRAIAARSDELGLPLRTRLEGVIDPRPEGRPLEP